MSDPGPVSLIPKSSKSTKKRRPGFRPGTKNKKYNQNKSKPNAASIQTENSTSVADQIIPTNGNSIDRSGHKSTDQEIELGKSKESVATQSCGTIVAEKSDQESLTKDGSDNNAGAENSTADTSAKSSTAVTVSKKKRVPNRKRKIVSSNNKRIQIGGSFTKKTAVSTAATSSLSLVVKHHNANDRTDQESSVLCIANLDQQQQKHNKNENSLITKESVASIATAMAMSSAVIPAFSSNDQDILNQINEENSKDSHMNTFCSRFKSSRRKIKNKIGSSKKLSQNSKKKKSDDGKVDFISTGIPTALDSATINHDTKENSTSGSTPTTGAPAVQIIDGEIVLQEASMMVPARRSVQEVEEEYQDNVVEEDAQMAIVQASYNSFRTKGDHGKTRKKGSWSVKETKLFYIALQQLGTDFGSMEALFFENQRTRRQLKQKYKMELNKNPDFVQEVALNPKYQIELDMAALNVEVDPKRIEAFENEEDPPYEPTDSQIKSSPIVEEANGPSNEVNEYEIVEEDAEEERLANEENLKTNDDSFWSKTGEEDQNEDAKRQQPEEEFTGPTMEDFFHDGGLDEYEFDNEGAIEGRNAEQEKRVALVPQKNNPKSRRPKIRPASRKKKKVEFK